MSTTTALPPTDQPPPGWPPSPPRPPEHQPWYKRYPGRAVALAVFVTLLVIGGLSGALATTMSHHGAAAQPSTSAPASPSAPAASQPPATSVPAAPHLTYSVSQIESTLVGYQAQDGTSCTAAHVVGTPSDDGTTETAQVNATFTDGTTWRVQATFNDANSDFDVHTEYQL